MLFRDFLLALPGLISPIATPSRANDTDLNRMSPAPITEANPVILSSSTTGQVAASLMPLLLTSTASAAAQYETPGTIRSLAGSDTVTQPLVLKKEFILQDLHQDITLDAIQVAGSSESALSPAQIVKSMLTQANLLAASWSDETGAGTTSGEGAAKPAVESAASDTLAAIAGTAGSVSDAVSRTPTIQERAEELVKILPDLLKEFPVHFVQNPGTKPTPETPGTDPEPNPVDPTPVDPTPNPSETLPLRLEKLTAEAGRVQIIEPSDADGIASIRILSQGSHGHVSVNPDGSLALVLSEDASNTGALKFSYEITYDNGDTRKVDTEVSLTPSQQQAGWSRGEVYMLEEGRDGNLVIEQGENHRKVYITQSDDGLTAAEIARAEGLKPEAITAAWLAQNPEYGASEDKALSAELGIKLWYEITQFSKGPNSNWLLLERGYDYDGLNRLVHRGANGESALHPIVIGAYGEGNAPTVGDQIQLYQNQSKHIVIRDIHLEGGFRALLGENIMLDNIIATGEEITVQNAARFTLRNSDVFDVINETPVGDQTTWQPHLNRKGGAYINGVEGLLLENNFFDHNGWAEGYDYNLAGSKPMPPSMYSHNFYLDASNEDLTFRDNITMRGASFGVQVRSGGFIEDNAIIDNNAAINFYGGNYLGAGAVGNYTLLLGNVITSASYKRVAMAEGALSYGIEDGGRQSSLIGNIVAHLADPNNAAEQALKAGAHFAYKPGHETYFNDTMIYNWQGSKYVGNENVNIGGLSANVLNQTTIQKYAAELLDKPTATIADLANYLRGQAEGRLDKVVDADVINAYFRAGFGLNTDLRAEAETLRFVPDDRGDGLRWDNRLNWSTEDLPGTQDGDSVDLGGNRVYFGAQTVDIDDFIFRDFGQIKVSSGRLNIEGETSVGDTGNLMQITNSGQVWMSGYRDSDLLKVQVEGGRFANTDAFVGKTQIVVSHDGQALLATSGSSMDLKRGSLLTVNGPDARMGFDGNDGEAATLRMHDGASLRFVATEAGFGQIGEFRSGAFGDTDVTSGVMLNGTLRINMDSWTGNRQATNVTLIDADQLIGSFDNIQISGLGQKRDALIRVDYVRDEVILVLGEEGKGSGQIRTATNGDANFHNYTHDASLKELWELLHDQAVPAVDDPLL